MFTCSLDEKKKSLSVIYTLSRALNKPPRCALETGNFRFIKRMHCSHSSSSRQYFGRCSIHTLTHIYTPIHCESSTSPTLASSSSSSPTHSRLFSLESDSCGTILLYYHRDHMTKTYTFILIQQAFPSTCH